MRSSKRRNQKPVMRARAKRCATCDEIKAITEFYRRGYFLPALRPDAARSNYFERKKS
jgi:hypothetical protein